MIQDKIAIVTGGSRGIGFAVAEALLRSGAKVAFCGTNQAGVDGALKLLSPLGDIHGAIADVSKYDDVKHFVASVQRRFHRVDILINNAGAGVFKPTADLAPAEWDRMIGVNLSGAYYCSHEILPILKQTGGGDIINISSLAGRNPFAGGAGYNASKFGINGFSEAMMLDHRNDGVRVSCIMPGSVATEFGGQSDASDRDWKIAPEDVADVVLFLLNMPHRTTVSRIEMRPSIPAKKSS